MNHELVENADLAQCKPKKLYQVPVLSVYGSVRELTQSGTIPGTENGPNPNKKPSSRDMKEKIVRIGTHPMGFGIYLFDYKPEFQDYAGRGRQFGVMIDEVVGVLPAAVGTDENGYPVVDYAMLDIHHSLLQR